MNDIDINNLTIYLDKQELDLRQKYLTVESNKRVYEELYNQKKGGTAKNENYIAKMNECLSTQESLKMQLRHIEDIKKEVSQDKFKWQ